MKVRFDHAPVSAGTVSEAVVIFEPDEEGPYRALADKAVDVGLLQAIALALEKLN